MPTPTANYRRLPGKGRRDIGFARFFSNSGASRLWLGEDHLLQVESKGYSESYKRFYLIDIQSFQVHKTRRVVRRFMIMIIMLVISVLVVVAGALEAGSESMYITTIGVICTVVFLFMIVWELYKGPTCTTHIQTAVQIEQLPSLGRQKIAQQVLAMLQPEIDHVQNRSGASATRSTDADSKAENADGSG